MKVAVIGVGAIGGWLAGRLALAGHEVSVIARKNTAEALRGGLRLIQGGREELASVRVLAEADGEKCDLLLLATKATGLAEAAEQARPLIGADNLILPLQNGVPWWLPGGEPLRSVDPDGRIAAALPLGQVLGGVVHAACRRSAPAIVEVVHADRLILGEIGGGVSPRVEALARTFADADVPAEASGDVRRAIWYKLWGNMTINPISATTGLTADRILRDPEHRAEIVAAMEEARLVGAAIGCPIEESAAERLAVTARLGAFKTSMLQDVEAGRPIELEALVGAVVEIARRVDVATPVIDALFTRTQAFAAARALLY
ncbi:2-dehydropantoate 2-reductase [uncultured Sphingomonas sp.]|uniref:ketopantoate reductase family protein n=1 Tax=uncultured Sphingomonas sp. TaxID=158754 RepID=UPI0025DF8A98|nr:2-dehydropantoate 2-reductase [uncultured Sphingomonas sp.]